MTIIEVHIRNTNIPSFIAGKSVSYNPTDGISSCRVKVDINDIKCITDSTIQIHKPALNITAP